MHQIIYRTDKIVKQKTLRRHDERLRSHPLGSATNHQRSYRQRSSARQPRRLRHHEQTTGYD